MFKLRLNAKHCISCGICMDVCSRRAIAMRINKSNNVEGEFLSYLLLHSDGEKELPPVEMMTFPYLAYPHLCDGCMRCVNECPVSALELQDNQKTMDESKSYQFNLSSMLKL
ncbi:MAG: ATP-binding protein [Bacteroidota bacterium]